MAVFSDKTSVHFLHLAVQCVHFHTSQSSVQLGFVRLPVTREAVLWTLSMSPWGAVSVCRLWS
jgi:hypothetical protein